MDSPLLLRIAGPGCAAQGQRITALPATLKIKLACGFVAFDRNGADRCAMIRRPKGWLDVANARATAFIARTGRLLGRVAPARGKDATTVATMEETDEPATTLPREPSRAGVDDRLRLRRGRRS